MGSSSSKKSYSPSNSSGYGSGSPSNSSGCGSGSPSNSSRSGKKKSNLNFDFSQMGKFSPNFYKIDSQEIKGKYLLNGNEGWKDFILKKINKTEESKKYAQNLAAQYNISVEELAYLLGDKDLFKKYLLRPIYNPLTIIESIHKELDELYKDSKELNDDEIREQINYINKRRNEILNSNVKFILTDIGYNQGIYGQFVTNFCNFFDKRFPYGALHAGLMIDESIIQWGSGNLGPDIVFPSSDLRSILFSIEIENDQKKEKIKNLWKTLGIIVASAVIVAPMVILGGPFGAILGSIISVGGISGALYYAFILSWDIKVINEKELDKIAEKCVFYNKRKWYAKFSNNCQHFVNDILQAIDAPFNPNGDLKNVINEISRNGYSTFSFKGTQFMSRREFDDYVKNIDFRKLCDDDKKLLLCYKSLYDVRLRIIQKEENQRELSEEEKIEKEKYRTDDEEFWNRLLSNEN